jgi:hypothetical protein
MTFLLWLRWAQVKADPAVTPLNALLLVIFLSCLFSLLVTALLLLHRCGFLAFSVPDQRLFGHGVILDDLALHS